MPYGITQCYLPPDRGVNPAFAPQPKQVLDLATPELCKAELTYVTWDLNPRPVNRKSNTLPQSDHATQSCPIITHGTLPCQQFKRCVSVNITPEYTVSQKWQKISQPYYDTIRYDTVD